MLRGIEKGKIKKVIHFEDQGQDFLIWGMDDQNTVILCEPFQGSVWCNKEVLNADELKEGGYVTIENKDLPEGKLTIKYPIVKIEKFK